MPHRVTSQNPVCLWPVRNENMSDFASNLLKDPSKIFIKHGDKKHCLQKTELALKMKSNKADSYRGSRDRFSLR